MIQFYEFFGHSVELLLLVPLMIGLFRWRSFSDEFKWIVLYLISEVIITLWGNYIYRVLHSNNLITFYYYSFFWNVTILGFFYKVSLHKKGIVALGIIGCMVVVLDHFFFSGDLEMNYRSGLYVNLVILVLGSYYLYIFLDRVDISSPVLLVLLALTIQFLIRSVDIIVKKYLLQHVFYFNLWYYESIIYYYLMLVAIGLFSYALFTARR